MSTTLWMPGVERYDTGRRLPMRGAPNVRLFTHHSFEAPYTYSPDCRAAARYLSSQKSDPHFVLHPITGALIQMSPINTGARTLVAAGASTNTWGVVHVQIEVIAQAKRPWTADLTSTGRATLRELLDFLRSHGITEQWCHGIRPPIYPGPGVAKKIQPTQSGHFHHAGWVVNSHGDPGAIADPWVVADITTPPVATPYPDYPAKAGLTSGDFWLTLQRVIESEGFTAYCGRSYWLDGRCHPGKGGHGHGKTSQHFNNGEALDFGRDDDGQAVSVKEKIYLSAKVRMLRDLYGPQMGWVLDRGPGDHEDHAHVQGVPNQTNGKLRDNTLAGVTMYGDRGQAVTDWQTALKGTGANLTPDGIFGLDTFWASKKWQASRGLTDVDGIIGAGSRTEMAHHLAQIAAGRGGEGVIDLTAIAGMLTALGYPADVPGLRAYQQNRGLEVDGIPGPFTTAALEADMATLNDIVNDLTEIKDALRPNLTPGAAENLGTNHVGKRPLPWFLSLIGSRIGSTANLVHQQRDTLNEVRAAQGGLVAGVAALNEAVAKLSVGSADPDAIRQVMEEEAGRLRVVFAEEAQAQDATAADEDEVL